MIKLPYKELPVKNLHKPTKDDFTKLALEAKEPFKITGSADNWILFKKLSQLNDPIDKCDYLEDFAVKDEVSFSILPSKQNGMFGLNQKLDQNFSFISKKTLFPDFIKQVKKHLKDPNKGTLYLQSKSILDLNNKLGPIDIFQGLKPISYPRFWIGTGSQFVSLHSDSFRNILAVLSGHKKVIMFPPEELPNIYPAPFDKRVGGVISSLVNAYNPDLKKFPRFSKALKKVKVTTINPGELLYVPPLWWHAVESEGFNIGVNCFFYDHDEKEKLSELYVPGVSLMVEINKQRISDNEKKLLYDCFVDIIDNDSFDNKINSKIGRIVIKEARNMSAIINNTHSSGSQKKLWRQWVKVFSLNYIFCLKGNPFPSLASTEYNDMIKRFEKNKPSISKSFYLLISTWIRKIFSCVFKKIMKNNKIKHGIVPS